MDRRHRGYPVETAGASTHLGAPVSTFYNQPEGHRSLSEGDRVGIRARWAVALLVASAFFALMDLFVVSDFIERGRVDTDLAERIFPYVVILSIAAIVVFVVWQYEAHSRLHRLGLSGLRFTPGWAVGWWFVPFANLVKPFQAMQELWKGSGPGASGGAWEASRAHPLIGVWWGTFLTSRVLAGFTRAAAGSGEPETFLWLAFPVDLLTIAAAVLAAGLIKSIEERLAYRERITVAAVSPDSPAS